MKFEISINDLEQILNTAKQKNEYNNMEHFVQFEVDSNIINIFQYCYYRECFPETIKQIKLEDK